jgi:fructose-specific phosphotransferase system IIC component
MQIILHCVRSVLSFLTGALHFAGASLGHILERFTPFHRPDDQLGRGCATLHIIFTLLAVTGAYAVVLKPAILYLRGFIGGWMGSRPSSVSTPSTTSTVQG